MSSDDSDCELRDDWFLEQDLNAWSSLAYVTAGVLLAWEVHRSRLPRAVYGLAAVIAAEGIGSLLYHGAASDLSQFLHDVALIGALAFVAGWHLGRLRGRADAGSLVGLAVGLAVSSVLWALAPGATNLTAAVAVVVIVTASLVARRRAMAGVWSWPLLVLGAVAVSMWGLGTPDSPVCDADSWLQAHALWHVLTAVVALAWVDRAYGTADPDHAPRLFRRFTDRSIGLVARGLVLATVLTSATKFGVLLMCLRFTGVSETDLPWTQVFVVFSLVQGLTVFPITAGDAGDAGVSEIAYIGMLTAAGEQAPT